MRLLRAHLESDRASSPSGISTDPNAENCYEPLAHIEKIGSDEAQAKKDRRGRTCRIHSKGLKNSDASQKPYLSGTKPADESDAKCLDIFFLDPIDTTDKQ